ncbi:MAG TPA: hypothetical protein VHU41_10200 [Thermoanaerobaculia bacterium]|nr:hypothetical protein [Thermoanaerobaculia bacterium]
MHVFAAVLALTVSIQIIPNTNDGRWTAVYRLSQPVERLDFSRYGPYKRLPKWRVETKGYTLVAEDEREAIVKAPGAKAQKTITVSFPVDTDVPVKDYQLFDPFSDGGVALYTGHFNLKGSKSTTFELAPRRGEHLLVGGKVFNRRTRWTDDGRGEGTFVYYGKVKPVETPYMVGILDPGAPKWLDERLDATLPQLFADYARLTGVTLAQRPTVLFSFEKARDPHSTTWKGGTLDGLIQLHVEAAADGAEDRGVLERFVKFIAHESAHLWNGQMFQAPEANQSWMHEGGADAFAWRAVRRARILDDAGLESRLTEDLNDCLSSIGTHALDDVEKRGDFGPVYSCGATLAWLTEAATGDLHAFWKSLFSAAEEHGRRYDESLYLSVLKQQERVPGTAAFIDDFVHHDMPDRAEKLAAAFRAAGVPVRPMPDAIPPRQRRVWGEAALSELMRQDCHRVSFDRASGRYQVHGKDTCATLKSDLFIDRIEGKSIAREGDAAYDAAAEKCAAHEAVTLEGPDDVKVSVPCAKALDVRTPWFGIARPTTGDRR